MKEEELEDSPIPEPSEPAKATRGRKPAAAAKAPASRSAGRSKVGTSAKKVVVEEPSVEPEGKENTPGGADDDEVAPLTKTKSTRKTTRRVATEEREEAPVETGKAKVSRSKAGTRR